MILVAEKRPHAGFHSRHEWKPQSTLWWLENFFDPFSLQKYRASDEIGLLDVL